MHASGQDPPGDVPLSVQPDEPAFTASLEELQTRAGELTGLALANLLCTDQLDRWQRGTPLPVEVYLCHFPALRQSADALLDLIYHEVILRAAHGECPSPEEYLQRFPEHAADLHHLFEVHQAVEAGFSGAAALLLRPPSTVRTDAHVPQSTTADVRAAAPRIPGYTLLQELGRGGMGVVYKARQLSLNRLVALKMIPPDKAGPEQVARFRQEAEAVARLHHPHIVQIHEVGEHDGQPFCCLEFLEGGSLDKKLAGMPQPPREAAQLLDLLARAMHSAHQAGIVHRDLKPANILLTADGAPKISDFGLAKILHAEAPKTHTGAILGTPPYMAPEQAAGRASQIGPHTDVYALGAILYELLTGRPPFRAASTLDTLEQVRSQEPVPPRQLQPKVARDLETICLKCLAKDPRKRYASALDLAEDCAAFVQGAPIRARPVASWERVLKWLQRRPALAALILVSVVALLSLVAGGLLYQDSRRRAAEEIARVKSQELNDRQRRDEVEQDVWEGERAVADQDWQKARLRLTQALARTDSETPAWQNLRERAEPLLRQANQQLAGLQARQDALARYELFKKRRDEALFHATLATGEGWLGNLQATRDGAREALGLYGLPASQAPAVAVDPALQDQERAALLADCYELLLVLAEAEATSLPPEQDAQQLRQGLRLLDQAALLGYPATQAYHLRRARYLEGLGQHQAAEDESQRAAVCPPTTALDHYLLGDEHYKQGELAKAAADFEKALGLQADHFWARYFLSVCYLRLQRPAEARLILTACLAQPQGRDFIWIYLLRGFAATELHDFQAAEEDFQTALHLHPGDDAAHVLYATRAVLWFQQEKFPEAEADLLRAIALKPEEYQAHVTLGQLYQKQHRWAEAVVQFDRAVEQEPDLPLLYRLRLGLHLERHDLEAALRDSAVAIARETLAGPSPTLARDHVERGRILALARRPQEALKAYEAALEIQPDNALAHLGRAETLLELHQDREAVSSFTAFLKAGGEPTADVYRRRGLARARSEDYPGAVQDYTRALELQPDAATQAARGWVYLASGLPRFALPDFQAVLRLEPANADAHTGRAYALVRSGRYREAVKDAETALQLEPATAQRLYDAVRIFAETVGQVDADPAPRDRLALEQRWRYQERALELLRQTLDRYAQAERASFWARQVHSDPALAPLRRSPGYAELEREYAIPDQAREEGAARKENR